MNEPAANASPSILTINGGSSSVKFAIFEGNPLRPIHRGTIERIGQSDSLLRVRSGEVEEEISVSAANPEQAAKAIFDWLDSRSLSAKVTAIGHRIVHGGAEHTAPQVVTPELLNDLEKLRPLDPAHLPGELTLIAAFTARFPKVPQIACFDTAFHRDLPQVAQTLPIPHRYAVAGIRRFGFHGLSFAFLLEELARIAGPEAAAGRVILAHLGSGSSLAAVLDGKCVDTTMGFTPGGGLMMGTRTGDIDPGVLIHLLRSEKLTADQLDQLVNRQSGLAGVSETSSDVRDLLRNQGSDIRAREALDLFCATARKWIGSMASVIGGIDTLVFAGGIGENNPEIRSRITEGLGFLGIQVDPARNIANEGVISSKDSPASVRMIRTDEEQMIARTVFRILDDKTPLAAEAPKSPHLPDELLHRMNAYWRAANYLSVGQIYLLNNPLLREPLQHKHVKPRLLGHWGTTPGLNLIYVHLNRVIRERDLSVLYVTGPGHGGPGLVANTYLEGTYTEVYPNISQDEVGIQKLFKQFSFPGGIPSHVAPETPGSIHEGGELGYALSHAFGAAFDNPDLLVACVVGDGEAETGPLATAWHSNKFLNPARDGAVLPILHLNGYKIANPCFLARIPTEELIHLFQGYGYQPYFVEGDDPLPVHRRMAEVLDKCVSEIQRIQQDARSGKTTTRPTWPMIILRTPKGWTCPKEIDGKKCEGYWRSHQVPMGDVTTDDHLHILEGWMKSYRPEELFDEKGRLRPELAELAPLGEKRMGANPHANGGVLLQDLKMPDFRDYAVKVPSPGSVAVESTRIQGKFLRDVMKLNMEAKNFRLFSPDECASNRWQDVFEVTNRCYMAEIKSIDDHLSQDGRVLEVLSEHQCEGWLEGYLLTGRHGFFSSYEAFIHIIGSMFNQHAKWLKVCHEIPWRKPIASLNYLLSSHVWRQDHNGFSHQDPGFIDHVINKKAEIIRVYLPADANCLLSVTDHCLRSRNYVNLVIAGKQSAPQWLTMEEALQHCSSGLGVWQWASNDQGTEPDVVMACCGDVPTLETLASVEFLRQQIPELKIRVINVVDLMKLQPESEHPHGLPDSQFDALFTTNKPIIFAFHGYPWVLHRLTYRRTNHSNLHVRGYKEEGTTTTPFDMCVLNNLDRFSLASAVIERVPGLSEKSASVKQLIAEKLAEHTRYICEHGIDMPEILNWKWNGAGSGALVSDTAGDQG